MTVSNTDIAAARRFHDATKYTMTGSEWDDAAFLLGDPAHQQSAIGEQDPALEPLIYKLYPSLPAFPLPRPASAGTRSALDAIASDGELPAGAAIPNLDAIARLCLRTNGLLKRWTNPSGRTYEFRAAGCTGARYHVELYVVCGDVPGLEAGVYHYGAHDHALRRLRAGDFRAAVVKAGGNEPALAAAPAMFITTSTFWRNAWRYQARAYRHVFWDTGSVLANLLAVAADCQLPTRPVLGFVDADLNALLDVDGQREAAIAIVAVGRTAPAVPASPAMPPVNLPTTPLSIREIEFPEIGAMHLASSLDSPSAVASWRRPPSDIPVRDRQQSPTIPLRPIPEAELPTDSIERVIEQRRSYRKYDTAKPLSFGAFSTVLACSGRAVRFDAAPPGEWPLASRYLLVNNVESLAPGIYAVSADATRITMMREGDVSVLAAELACYQEYAQDAHVNVYELADLARALGLFGNRGYRAAQLEAAIAGSRLQLAAHALGLGAVGSTSLDDRVTETFSPDTLDLSFMFIAVFGERLRKPAAAG